MRETAVLTIQCPDQPGIVAKISTWVFEHQANITRSDQYSTDPIKGQFFMRLEFCFDSDAYTKQQLEKDFKTLADPMHCQWEIYYKSEKLRFAILVSQHDHCLLDLLYHWHAEEIAGEITAVISNHPDCERLADQHQLLFYHLPISKNTKQQQEQELFSLVDDVSDFLVLARYMQILTPEFLALYGRDIINIHHSFLPSFIGAEPYHQAHERGVKLIGATAHYVTQQLDEGPIIEQSVESVSHHDDVNSLIRKGKHIEKHTLVKAVIAHCEHRVMRLDNKTIVFE